LVTRKTRVGLCLHESGEAPARALAKLAFAELVSESREIRNSVDGKVSEFSVGGEQVKRGMAEKACPEWLTEFEVIDAEKFEGLLHLGEKTSFVLDTLRGDDVVSAAAAHVQAQEHYAEDEETGQHRVEDVIRQVLPLENEDSNGSENYDPQKRDELADAVDQCRVPVEQGFLGFEVFGGSVGGEVGVAEAALERYGFDGLAADGARFCIFVHGALLSASGYSK